MIAIENVRRKDAQFGCALLRNCVPAPRESGYRYEGFTAYDSNAPHFVQRYVVIGTLFL
jgi:hypothetical protein